ncbi:Hypothetical predicted protein [Olea europaea subsp. europaea]|uniref:(S)-ureidoglycine aminohydrolase cupin domain-containing protein n=3 Tax=Olea europaea subsp. europaea TaxID=158383 RepID=A0A8S0P8N0_OLEEU|nr:Hypothetical predicted protein [Olea europaea subsp. europaea]
MLLLYIYIHTLLNHSNKSKPKVKNCTMHAYTNVCVHILFLVKTEPSPISLTHTHRERDQYFMAAESSSNSSTNLRIVVQNNPSDSQLSELGIKSWPKWGCPPGKYQLKFDEQETCYLVRGKVKVKSKNSSEVVEFGAGDLVILPKGLSCTWDVSVAVDKHYKFDTSSSPSSS